MTILAHLSDLHLIERHHTKRGSFERTRLAFLSAGAPLDAEARIADAKATLAMAARARVDHVLITGDLTEDGSPAQFETLAEVLAESGLAPERVTLVPGNHDGYGERGAFSCALEGPLAAYRGTSEPGRTLVLEDVVIRPTWTMIDGQWCGKAGGVMREHDLQAIRALAGDAVARERAVVVAQHHPPVSRTFFPLEWLDGVHNAPALRELLLERSRLHVVHGHVHRHLTRTLCGREHAQIFATSSVRDGGAVLRLYAARGGVLHDVPLPSPLRARQRDEGGRAKLAHGHG